MTKKLLTLAVAGLMITAAGCVDSTTLVTVNKDGSGTIVQKYYMSAQALAMTQGMQAQFAAGMGADGGGAMPQEDPVYDEAKFKEAATKMGEGVTFVSGKRIEKDDGSKGGEVRYAFKDITKLSVRPFVGGDEGGGVGGGMQIGGNDDPISFGFEKGATPTLTINLPQKDDAAAAEPAEGMDPAMMAQQQAMGMAMMKPFMEGMRIRMFVKVNGEIEDSNATYITKNRITKKKQIVGLMDMNIGEMMKNPDGLTKMMATQNMSPAKAMEALKEFPEIKMETQEKVTVTFK